MVPEFQGRNLVIATMYCKERAMRSLLEQKLGVIVHVTQKLDTDSLGTFSGEVERKDSPIETALKKCELALEETGFDLVVASEGSLGPHPMLFGIPVNEELVVLYDHTAKITCYGKELSTETNYNHGVINSFDKLLEFAQTAHFPSHGLILKNASEKPTEIIKGINNQEQLEIAFNQLIQNHETLYVETDMRAMQNPMRMKVITKATNNLINTLKMRCPACRALNFSINNTESGLPCSACGLPTKSTLAHVYICKKCNFNKRYLYPKNKKSENPQYCDYCNP